MQCFGGDGILIKLLNFISLSGTFLHVFPGIIVPALLPGPLLKTDPDSGEQPFGLHEPHGFFKRLFKLFDVTETRLKLQNPGKEP